MKILTILATFILSCHVMALVPENYFQDDEFIIDRIISSKAYKAQYLKAHLTSKFEQIKFDPDDRVHKSFDIPKYFEHSVRFWFNIYTLYDTNFVVVHDKENLALVYDVIDYRELNSSKLGRFTKSSMQSHMTMGRVKTLRESFDRLARGKNGHKVDKHIISVIKKGGLKIPMDSKRRKKFFYKLSSNLRAQTGQHSNVARGLDNYAPFSKTIEDYLRLFKIPKSLVAISFVESSFNPYAKSRAGATGTWQFINLIGKHFMRVDRKTDQRLNPVIATLGAFQLLKQNKQILSHWDLAVTAFNSGTKHLIRARKKLRKSKKKVNLVNVFKNYKHPHLGFASKNYYSEFLAMSYALAYKEQFFSAPKAHFKPKRGKLNVFVSKYRRKPSTLYKKLKKSSPHMSYLNSHLRRKNHVYPKGTVFVSDLNLSKKRYYKVEGRELAKLYPKNFRKYVFRRSKKRRN